MGLMAMVARTDGAAMVSSGPVWKAACYHCCHCLGAEMVIVDNTLSPLAHSPPPKWHLGGGCHPRPRPKRSGKGSD